MAKAKVDPLIAAEELALQTLNSAIASPTAALFAGTTAKVKAAAELAVQRGWATPVDVSVGKKTVRTYRMTPAGVNHALTNGEPNQLMKGVSEAVAGSRAAIAAVESELKLLQEKLNSNLRTLHDQLQGQTTVLERLMQRVVPPNLDELLNRTPAPAAAPVAAAPSRKIDADLLEKEVVRALQEFKRRANAGQFCTLKELYELTGAKLGATVGEFHACLRDLDHRHKIRLVAWGSPMYELQEEVYALVSGKEVKFYAYLDG